MTKMDQMVGKRLKKSTTLTKDIVKRGGDV